MTSLAMVTGDSNRLARTKIIVLSWGLSLFSRFLLMAPLYPVGIITSCLSPVVPFAVTSALATGKSPLLIWSLLLISPLVCNDDDDAEVKLMMMYSSGWFSLSALSGDRRPFTEWVIRLLSKNMAMWPGTTIRRSPAGNKWNDCGHVMSFTLPLQHSSLTSTVQRRLIISL